MLRDESSLHAAWSEPRFSITLSKQKFSLLIYVAMIRFHEREGFTILLRAAADVMRQRNRDRLTERKLGCFNADPDEGRYWLHITTRHVEWAQQSDTKFNIDYVQATGNGSFRNGDGHVIRL